MNYAIDIKCHQIRFFWTSLTLERLKSIEEFWVVTKTRECKVQCILTLKYNSPIFYLPNESVFHRESPLNQWITLLFDHSRTIEKSGLAKKGKEKLPQQISLVQQAAVRELIVSWKNERNQTNNRPFVRSLARPQNHVAWGKQQQPQRWRKKLNTDLVIIASWFA